MLSQLKIFLDSINVDEHLYLYTKLYGAKFLREKIFADRPLANFHGNKFHRSRIPISDAHFWRLRIITPPMLGKHQCSAFLQSVRSCYVMITKPRCALQLTYCIVKVLIKEILILVQLTY